MTQTTGALIFDETAEPERKGTEAADAYSVYEEIIKDNIEYEHFIKHTNIDRERLDEIVSLILETVCTLTLTTTTGDCIVGIALKCLYAANGSRPAWSTGTTGILWV